MNAIIQSLDSAFESGDAEHLASLYKSNGRENAVRGSRRIAKRYARHFERSSNRSVNYEILTYNFSDASKLELKGTMVSSYVENATGKERRTAATVYFVMVPVAEHYKIQLFEWRKF